SGDRIGPHEPRGGSRRPPPLPASLLRLALGHAHERDEHLVGHAASPGLGHEGRDLDVQLAQLARVRGDHRAATGPHVQEALVAQLLVRVEHGVEVDVELLGHGARRRQPLAHLERTPRDVRADRGGDLREQRLGRGGVDAQQHHALPSSAPDVVAARCASAVSSPAPVAASSTVTAMSRPDVRLTQIASPSRSTTNSAPGRRRQLQPPKSAMPFTCARREHSTSWSATALRGNTSPPRTVRPARHTVTVTVVNVRAARPITTPTAIPSQPAAGSDGSTATPMPPTRMAAATSSTMNQPVIDCVRAHMAFSPSPSAMAVPAVVSSRTVSCLGCTNQAARPATTEAAYEDQMTGAMLGASAAASRPRWMASEPTNSTPSSTASASAVAPSRRVTGPRRPRRSTGSAVAASSAGRPSMRSGPTTSMSPTGPVPSTSPPGPQWVAIGSGSAPRHARASTSLTTVMIAGRMRPTTVKVRTTRPWSIGVGVMRTRLLVS